MSSIENNNLRKGLKFRELTALILAADGHKDAKPRKHAPKLSESFTDGVDQGDVTGIPGWTILTRHNLTRDLSGALDEAQERAEVAGTPFHATVWSRPRRPADESYVVMSLAQLSTILHRLQTDANKNS